MLATLGIPVGAGPRRSCAPAALTLGDRPQRNFFRFAAATELPADSLNPPSRSCPTALPYGIARPAVNSKVPQPRCERLGVLAAARDSSGQMPSGRASGLTHGTARMTASSAPALHAHQARATQAEKRHPVGLRPLPAVSNPYLRVYSEEVPGTTVCTRIDYCLCYFAYDTPRKPSDRTEATRTPLSSMLSREKTRGSIL